MGLSVEEQELHINASRSNDVAEIYVSDSTWITKLDKLVEKNPEEFKVIYESDWGKCYSFPKKCISIRSSSKREVSDEQRKAASERFKKMHSENKKKDSL